ncbi:hypothetical protein QF026_004664 [Streptomyces aurantiacus]|uniref:hypothetical protein n=1 Tax=Streptomyces aurantiacus TaxID=47760 RepID=UPI00278D9207|nr:hypothetical protein [Streptomyces aurantiacus]
MLVQHLPRDSATARELHGEAADWSVTDYLLASVVDQLAEANWMFATVNRDEDSEPLEFPEALPRPGDEPNAGPTERTATGAPTAEELTRFFL